MAKDEQNQFQLFGTFLAFLLPILQFFFTFLPASAKNLFLIRDYFLFVSIATALFSYILILVFKNVIWFQVPLKPKKHRKYEEFQKKTSPSTYSEEEIRQYIRSLKSQPRKPYYITQENAYLVLIPLLLISYLGFFSIGLFTNQKYPQTIWIFLQSIAYLSMVALTVLTLAIYYVRDSNKRKFEEQEQKRVEDVKRLAYENNAFDEIPKISLIAQVPFHAVGQYLTILKVNSRFYKVTTDPNMQKILQVEGFDQLDALYNSIGSK